MGIGCTSNNGDEGEDVGVGIESGEGQREGGERRDLACMGDLRATVRLLSTNLDTYRERGFILAKDIYACLTLASMCVCVEGGPAF